MEAAQSEYDSDRNTTAVRNLYYACFYVLTAVLLKEGRSFKKHTGVKAAAGKDDLLSRKNWGNNRQVLVGLPAQFSHELLYPRSCKTEKTETEKQNCGGFRYGCAATASGDAFNIS